MRSRTNWKRKTCGCVKADLPRAGRVSIRFPRHRGKPSKKRMLAYFDADGIVRAET